MKQSELVPLFIFSMPRSGSTLLQRILGSHPAVATAAEPWFLLPFVSTLTEQDTYAGYDYELALTGIKDFCSNLPDGQAGYRQELRKFALGLYRKAAPNGETLFLDKTPRYHHQCRTIMELFPEGKFIFLWRNPLASAASMIQSFAAGRWNLHRWKIDLYWGLEELVATFLDRQDDVIALRYEDLLTSPGEVVGRACDYIGVDFDDSMLADFGNTELKGRFGDPFGLNRYSGVLSREPLTAWTKVYCNPVRKHWGARYLRWIGAERLKVMGYDIEELRRGLDQGPSSVKFLVSDLGRMSFGVLFNAAELRLSRDKFRRTWSKNYAHG